MTNLGNVLAWKYPGQGWRCEKHNGEWTVTEFPGGIPKKRDIAKWIKEYEEHLLDIEHILKREKEYPDIAEMVVALWEMIVEGRTEAVDALQKMRKAVKDKYPKPEWLEGR